VKLLQNLGGFHCDHDSGAVVDRARAQIPRIEVSRDNDELLGMFATLQIGDDVIAGSVGQLLRSEGEMHADRALRGKMSDQIGIFRGDGTGGNPGRETEAGVGQTEVGASDRADQSGHCA
jgi:hypothetical protein